MNSLLARRGVRQFVKFALVGLSSTAIDWSIFYLLNSFFGLYYLIAKILSFSVAVINSYTWNRCWTFRSQNPYRTKEFSQFLTVALVGLSLNTFIMYLVVTVFGGRKIIGLILATGIVVFWDFLANKFYTFKESQQ